MSHLPIGKRKLGLQVLLQDDILPKSRHNSCINLSLVGLLLSGCLWALFFFEVRLSTLLSCGDGFLEVRIIKLFQIQRWKRDFGGCRNEIPLVDTTERNA